MQILANLLGRWVRQAKRLFHVAVGLVFLGLAAAAGFQSLLEWRIYQENRGLGWVEFAAILVFTILLVILSLYSFTRARTVR